MIRVLLADDQTLVRHGIRRLLELTPDIRVAGEAAAGDEALAAIAPVSPDVVLLDVRMPGLTGIEVLRALAARPEPPPPAILLTTFDDDQALLDGIRAGARGFLLKDVSLDELAGAIRGVARGETAFRPGLTERVLRHLASAPPRFASLDPPDPLTPREREVARLMAAGLSNREIGEALGTAEGTVKNHASSILSKLGVRDRTRAVLKAIELGWV